MSSVSPLTSSISTALSNGNELPSWLSFAAANMHYSGTPENSDIGTYEIVISASDNSGAFVSENFTIEVLNVNDAPVLNVSAENQNATVGAEFTYVLPANMFSDVDADDVLSYNSELLPEWLTFDNSNLIYSGTPTEESEIDVMITAYDQSLESASDDFTIFVSPLVNIGLIEYCGEIAM